MKTKSCTLTTLRVCNWDFEKAAKLEKARSNFNEGEFELLVDSIEASNELAVGVVNESRLNKILKHVNKNKKQYATLTCLSLFLLLSGASSFALPTTAMAGIKTVGDVTLASASLPSFSIGSATSMINKLIVSLIKLGVLATVASCVFEMLKSIIEGNLNRLPKTLITHAMMCCSVLLAPSVFNYISNVFNMGNILSMIGNIMI